MDFNRSLLSGGVYSKKGNQMLQQIQSLKTMTWYSFTQTNLSSVVHAPGVYFLGINNNTIYIGSTHDLNERLAAHYNTSDPCIKQARQFAIDPCMNYKERERQQLEDFRSRHGRLPACNDI